MSVAAILLLGAGAIAQSVSGEPRWAIASVIAILVLLVAQRHAIPRRILVTSGITAAIAVLVLPFAADPWRALAAGIHLGGIFVALMASVGLLANAASRAGPVRQMADELLGRGPRLWGVPLVVVAHLFPAMLNIAGTAILCDMAGRRKAGSDTEQRVLDEAVYGTIRRGFACAVCWSPMFGNIAILLALYPTIEWPDVAPYAIPAGLILSLLSLLIGPLRSVSDGVPASVRSEVAALARTLAPLFLGMTAFLTVALLVHRQLGISVALAIIGLSPLVALLWTAVQTRHAGAAVRQVGQDVRQKFPTLAPEAVLFAASGCMAVVVGAAVPEAMVAAVLAPVQGSALLALLAVFAINIALALAGMHPLLVALLLVNVVPPEALGLSPMVHLLAILLGLSLTFVVSPFTIISVLIDRYVHRGPFEISYAWGWRFVLAGTVVMVALLWAIEVDLPSWWSMG